MTHDEIMKLEAGRELDALVAEKVMGYTPVKVTEYPAYDDNRNWVDIGDYVIYPEGVAFCTRVKDYSTDISAAWQVMEKIESLDNVQGVGLRGGEYYWKQYSLRWNFWVNNNGMYPEVDVYGETAPLAICRAALMAVQA